jgi:hypothetical protein
VGLGFNLNVTRVGTVTPAAVIQAASVDETTIRTISAANDLIAWETTANTIESTFGRLSLDSEAASAPDVLWLGGSRYLVAYEVLADGASRIELVTIDVNTRRRAVR